MITILGAGAVGQLLAHKLTDASVDCQLIVRDMTNYSAKGWLLTEQGKSFEKSFLLSDSSDNSPLGLVAVCVKSYQLDSALAAIRHRLTDNSRLILFQNGMGHEQIAKQFVSKQQLFYASNTHGIFKTEQQSIQYAGRGSVQFGQLSNQITPEWFKTFKQADLSTSWTVDIHTVLYKKLLVNAVINPLTALYQCKNGGLLEENKTSRLLALINENNRFAKQIGLSFETSFKDLVIRVIEQTANNYSSMYQDVQKNQITEINAINGYLLDQMAQADFDAAHNWRLWSDFHISFPPQKAKREARAKQFDPLQFQVTQQAGTERPFTGVYNQHSETGDYLCACCDSPLFDNNGKFDSHCGWPSFDRASNNKAVAYREDNSHNMHREEILCAQCGSHLGHVFEDGPTETGARFCVNSTSLDFKPQD